MKKQKDKLRELADSHGGYFRFSEAIIAGIHRATLHSLRNKGFIELVSRGLYRMAEAEPHPYPDFAQVALRAPNVVVCLISALSFHGITTQIPHQVDLAVVKGARPPQISYPPIEVYHVSEPAFSSGIETHVLGGVDVRIYSIEKTLADCFKFRNQIGTDVAVEALKLYREQKRLNVKNLMKYSRLCRVVRVMEPYLEALI